MKKEDKEVEYNLELIKDPTSFSSNEYRRLQLNIEFTEKEIPFKVIQVVSANPAEGKTSTVVNLACAYREKRERVLIVDLDLRKPKIHKVFNLLNENGLSEYFSGKITKKQLIKDTPFKIDVIIRGEKVPNPNLLLESNHLIHLFEELKNEYDVILLDCPPVLNVSDSLLMKHYCDACLFVCAHRKTKRDEVRKAYKALKNANINIIGNVITFKEIKKNKYYDYRYE